jgi:dipeptidyl-peptidase-4
MNKMKHFTFFVLSITFFTVSNICGQNSKKQVLNNSESRLRAIYDRNEFRAKRLRANWLPDGSGYTLLELDNESQKQILVRYEMANGNRTVIDSSLKEENLNLENISPDGKRIFYYQKGNLHVQDLRTNQTIQITDDGTAEMISNGNAVWSPDGKKIAYVQRDQSNVRLRPMLVPSDPTYPEVKSVRYARVGETIPSLRVGVVAAGGGSTHWLNIPVPAEGYYLGQVSWAENSDELLVEKLSRGRDVREFLIADVSTGSIDRIYHESDPAWVIASYRKNMGLDWIREGNAFIVLSEKDGWRHAYIYSRDGIKESILTPGKFDIIERAKVDEDGGWFYYYASPENATQKYLYRVRLDGTQEPARVTPLNQPGTHNYDFSPDGKWAFHTYSNFDTPPVTELVELPEHRIVRILEENYNLRAKMETLISHPTEFIRLDIGNNVVMDAWMMKPTDFDPSKKYPLFVYVYGEPHAQTVLDSWGTVHADFHRLIAELGYLVVSIDGRGTPAPKGAAWRRAIFPSLGPLSTEEQAAGVQELGRTRPYVDMSRIGIWGWSGGGSNTLNAMFRDRKSVV